MRAFFGGLETDVAVHSGPDVSRALSTLGAIAASQGGEVYFAQATPSVGTAAHEFAHALQQRGGTGGTGTGQDSAEREAERAERAAVLGGPIPALSPMPADALLRKPSEREAELPPSPVPIEVREAPEAGVLIAQMIAGAPTVEIAPATQGMFDSMAALTEDKAVQKRQFKAMTGLDAFKEAPNQDDLLRHFSFETGVLARVDTSRSTGGAFATGPLDTDGTTSIEGDSFTHPFALSETRQGEVNRQMEAAMGKVPPRSLLTAVFHLHPVKAANSGPASGYLSTRDIFYAAKPNRRNVLVAVSDTKLGAHDNVMKRSTAYASAIAVPKPSTEAYTPLARELLGVDDWNAGSQKRLERAYRDAFRSSLGIIDGDEKFARFVSLVYNPGAAYAYVARPQSAYFELLPWVDVPSK